ncbi:MAG TPA: MarR family transcriptional regulator [Steroidobacteraceae bacterium]|jgi:DNA-binding MarR family transcriptional regulator
MADFIRQQGAAFLAHLLRRLSDDLVRGGSEWYPEVGVTAAPRTTSTLLALAERGPLGVTEIADILRQSHPLVITWLRQLKADGFIRQRADSKDKRRTVVALTAKGASEVTRLREALRTMRVASQRLMDDAAPGLMDALWKMEQACRDTPFAQQLRKQAKSR